MRKAFSEQRRLDCRDVAAVQFNLNCRDKINHLVVAEGHRLVPEAVKQVRVDSFVMETNIHWPTESTLIRDGLRKLLPWCVALARLLRLGGWRQAAYLFQKVKRRSHSIE